MTGRLVEKAKAKTRKAQMTTLNQRARTSPKANQKADRSSPKAKSIEKAKAAEAAEEEVQEQ